MKYGWRYAVQAPEGDPGEGGAGGEGGDPPPPPRTIALDVLPEELRDMSENEIKFFLSKTLSGVKDTNERNRELSARLEALEQTVRTPAREPAAPDPHEGKTLNELILEDPEAAIERVAIAKGWIRGMQEVGTQAGEALFDTLARKIDGFEDHEDDVRKLLRETNAPINKDTVARAFEMVVGRKAIEEKSRSRRAAAQDPAPKPTGGAPKKELPPENDLERQIREAAGKSREQWEALKNEEFEIKVPLSPTTGSRR
jgi:hypothetical protein